MNIDKTYFQQFPTKCRCYFTWNLILHPEFNHWQRSRHLFCIWMHFILLYRPSTCNSLCFLIIENYGITVTTWLTCTFAGSGLIVLVSTKKQPTSHKATFRISIVSLLDWNPPLRKLKLIVSNANQNWNHWDIFEYLTMDKSFTKHLSFSLLAKNFKTKFWSTILKSFWDFLIFRESLNHFDPVLLPLASAEEHRIKVIQGSSVD